ncbi:MAG: DegT/DnrJ/EryC1/StrS family aminotransferase [Candidatus Omnitrophota bacterium]|nr:DegT/DnrJ/EryC1/StrS family aminotransferase [Candidatus Omnitrophota bacterium]
MRVEFFKHSINERDIKRVEKILKTIFLTTGDEVEQFENNFAKYLGSSNAIGVTSCTAALHLCLLAWGIGEGDEVITAPMSFCATSNAIIHAGATPVFIDVEEETANINAELIEGSITKKTKAIIPVHLYGQMCDMKKIKQIADRHNLIIIEDAAHCIEGVRDGIRVGHFAAAACFSFYATKNITCGEGGAIVTNNSKKTELLRILRLHGMDKSAAQRYTKRYEHWDMPVLGWKYNMDNIRAALLLGQLDRIEALWKLRSSIWARYKKAFSKTTGIKLTRTMPCTKHAKHLFTIRVPENKRDAILFTLQKRGIGVAVNYRPIHLLKYYRQKFGYKTGFFPVAESIGKETISLPLYPALKEKEVSYVIQSVLKVTKE